MDLENLFSTQEYYAGQSSGQGSGQGSDNDYYAGQGSDNDYYAGQGSGNDYYVGGNQDYSMGHSSTHGSAPVEDVSPIEEVEAPAKSEEVALCQAWCDVLENSIIGNTMKSKGFWLKVIEYFEKMRSHRGYNFVLDEWKNRVRPRIGEFFAIFDNV
nr:hypothetical protein [Tanacetum cinerariifolium]